MKSCLHSLRLLTVSCLMLICLSGLTGCGYNELQTLDEEINNKWAQVENQLQRRTELIPNLVKTVQAFAKHEKAVFTAVADARARMSGAIQSNDPEKVAAATGEFNTALGRLLVVAENYPQLKADQHFTRLMDELAGTENRLTVARMDYNNTVRDYNGMVRRFPTNLTAMMFHAEIRKYYNPPAASMKPPEVQFDEGS